MSSIKCISCGNNIAENDDYCTLCGTHRPLPGENSCINPQCGRFKAALGEHVHYCGECGKPTRIGNQIEKLI